MRELTHGLGADAVWDCVGGNDFFQLSLACARLGGTVIVLGTPTDQGSRLELDALAVIGQQVKIAGVRGATLRDQQLCLELLAAGKITPIIDRAFPCKKPPKPTPTSKATVRPARCSSCPEPAGVQRAASVGWGLHGPVHRGSATTR